jgi:hypothetical protein
MIILRRLLIALADLAVVTFTYKLGQTFGRAYFAMVALALPMPA